MSKKVKMLQRIIALVLVAAMWWQTDSMRFFSTAYAAENEVVVNELIDSDVTSAATDSDIPITVLGEVESLRTEDEKHFRMSDGSFMAVSYGMPVHYRDAEGEWQDIDNCLVLSEDREEYQTYNLQSTTSFASTLGSGNLFEASYGDTSVSVSLLDTVNANILMNSAITSVSVIKQSDMELDIESILETERITDAGEVPETKQESEVWIQEEEILTMLADSELLTFDRTTIADTTVEIEDILSASGDLSGTDDLDGGWTMEDILPENIQDSLLYEDVFPGVDLLYTKYSHNVKEQIIVNSPQASYRYDFKLTLEGVEAVLNDDGSVSLLDVDSQEEMYYIPAPYMEDANGAHSYDVEYVLTSTADGVVLTVIADANWMNDSERAFPVAIDPTLIVKGGTGDRDIFISYSAEGAPDTPYKGETYIGYTTYQSMKEYQAYAHFNNLPQIPEEMTVVKADFYMIQRRYDGQSCDELGIGVYEVTEDKPSAKTYFDWIYEMTWNTRPAFDDTNMIDYTFVTASGVGQSHTWDLTELVKKWYIEGTVNRTIAMTMLPGQYTSTCHAEASFYEYDNGYPPILAVYYRDTVGLESYYTYQTMGVGNAGTAYIADATGQLKVVNPLVTYASTINPFALSLVYNSDYFQSTADADYQPPVVMGQENADKGIDLGTIAMKLGAGWTLDIIQTMHAETIGEGDLAQEYLCYTDGDGTRHYFVKDDERNAADDSDTVYYYDEDGLGLKAEITNTGKTSFVMYDDSGNRWNFMNGRLISVSDETGNLYGIAWNSEGRILQITQVNKGNSITIVARFAYSGDYVSSIQDAAGNIYSFSYTDGKLTGILRNGTQTAIYTYPANGNMLASMKDEESGYARGFGYSHGKVIAGSEYVNSVYGNSFSVSYPNYSKTVYRTSSPEGVLFTSYLFDYSGRTVNAYVTDENNNILGASNAVYTDTQVGTEESSSGSTATVDKKANRTEKIGSMGVSNPTLFHYGNCENTGWSFVTDTTGAHTASFDTGESRTGVYSLKMVSQNGEEADYAFASSVALEAGTEYTGSAYVKTTDCSGFSGEGIYLKAKNALGNSYTGKGIAYATSENIDEGWSRISVTFTAETTGSHALFICSEGTTGTFYVDDVQLEEGEIPGTYNLLKNGSMETDPCGWNGFNGAGYSAGTGWNQSQSMAITGNPVKDAYIQQEVSINLPATETFVLSGWAKGNSVPDNLDKQEEPAADNCKQFGLRAVITYQGSTEEEYHYVPFNPEVSEWQFASLSIVPKAEDKTRIITSIRVICTFEGNANVAYFDNICLLREVAQTMEYDEEGNLQSVNTPDLSEDVNTYENGNLIKTVTGGNGTYTYTYDETYSHRQTSVTDSVITQNLSYDSFGNVSSTTLKSNDGTYLPTITTSAEYSTDGNRITGLTDAVGNSIGYDYGNLTSIMYGLPTTTTDGRGNSTTAVYDSEGRTTTVTVPEKVEVSYTYDKGLLTSIGREDISETETSTESTTETGTAAEQNTQEYRFTYDAFGRTTAIHVGENLLASYTYRSNGDLISMTYGNGTTVSYSYDILGRVVKETYFEEHAEGSTVETVEGRTVEYFYDNNGQICSITDSVSGTTDYIYDKLGRLAYLNQEETGVRIRYTYDANNRLTYTAYQIEDCYSGTERYGYNTDSTDQISDGTMTGMQMITAVGLSRTLDPLQRLTQRSIPGLTENYTYAAGVETNTTTTQVAGKTNTLGETVTHNFRYTYDGNGNILTITDTVTGETITYSYDALNQLTGAVYSTGRTESYSYDSAGNILSFNNGTSSHTYTYGNSDWKDQLTAVDGVEFTYDAIGNPLTYHNGSTYTMNWTEGRRLATITTEGKTTAYLYDADGIRIQKTNSDGSCIRYIKAGGKVLGEKHYSAEGALTKQLRYIFDENGSVCGYMSSTDGISWTQYYFITNLQGDVLQVYRVNDRAIVASYSYDSWGNILSATGEKAEENPFRYRGYYYDGETGFYYLQSRYYDPEIGRFINADGFVSTGQGITGQNMYAYCGNNPVNRVDYAGQYWSDIWEFTKAAATEIGKTMGLMSPAYVGCGGVAAADGPLPFGDIIGFGAAVILTIGAIGYGISQATQEGTDAIKEIQDIAQKYGIYECEQAAYAMQKQNGNKGNIVRLEFSGARNGYVVSDRYPSTAISLNGKHYGYMYNKIVYCNVYPEGKPLALWILSFHCASGRAPDITIY